MMAALLDTGNWSFLSVKIVIGLVTAIVLYRWGSRPLARYGLAVALAVYIGLMGIHIFTGLAAFGVVSNTTIQNVTDFHGQLFATLI